jgi:GAF domain-containing protein
MREELATTRRALGATTTQLKTTKAHLARQLADLQRLHHLGMRLSAHVELATLLQEVLSAVCELQRASVGLLMLFDADRRELEMVASVGLSADQVKRVPRIPFGVGPCGLAVSARRAVIIKDLQRETRLGPRVFHCRHAPARSSARSPRISPNHGRAASGKCSS